MSALEELQDTRLFEEMIPASQLANKPQTGFANTTTPFAHAFEDIGLQDIVSCQASHGGMVQHLMSAGQPVIWVQDYASRWEFGAPFLQPKKQQPDILHVPTRNARDTLWVMEEAVKAGVNVVGEIMGTPSALDFTATRRLELFSRAAGVRCLLVRTGQQASVSGSSGAKWRWRVDAVQSEPHPFDPRAPGNPRWSLELLRAHSCPPGRWIVEIGATKNDSGTPHHLRLVSSLAVGDLAAGEPQREACKARSRSVYGTGNVIALR